jgi:hypothetical protein
LKYLRTLAAVGVAVLAGSAPAAADPGITIVPTAMMSAPSSKSRTVMRIPANAEIEVLGCRSTWCEISWRNVYGYALARNIDFGAIPEDGPTWRGPVYAPPPPPPPPVYMDPPTVYGGGIIIGPQPRVWTYGY